MAPALPDFPTELLLQIAESGTSLEQVFAHTTLRATCRKLNGKLVRYFGSKHFHTARPKLMREDLQFLLETSKRSIGRNIQTVELSVSTLFTPMRLTPDCDPTDASRCSWVIIEQELSHPGIDTDHSHFNDEVWEIIIDGSCASMLSGALSALPAVKSLKIRPPSVPDGMKAATLHSLRRRWTFALKVLLSAILSRPNTLEELRLEAGRCDLAVPVCTFDVTAADASLSDSINKLYLSLTVVHKQALYHAYARELSITLAKLANLTHLQLSFPQTPGKFFKRLSCALRPLHLRNLGISNIATCCKNLRRFLESCGSELTALTLVCIDFARFSDFSTFFGYLSHTANLRSCFFRKLNFGSKGLRFGVLNLELAHASSTRVANRGPKSDSELIIIGKEVTEMRAFLKRIVELRDVGPAWPRVERVIGG